MNTGFKILAGVVVVGVIALLLTFFLKNYQIVQRDLVTGRDTILIIKHDTVHFTTVKKMIIPRIFYRDSIIYTEVDTSLILQDYLCTWIYDDTLKDDREAFLTLSDTVTRNRITGRRVLYSNRVRCPVCPVLKCPEARNKIFAGVNVGYSGHVVLAPTLYYLSKKDYLINISYDIPGVGVTAGIAFKLGQ